MREVVKARKSYNLGSDGGVLSRDVKSRQKLTARVSGRSGRRPWRWEIRELLVITCASMLLLVATGASRRSSTTPRKSVLSTDEGAVFLVCG